MSSIGMELGFVSFDFEQGDISFFDWHGIDQEESGLLIFSNKECVRFMIEEDDGRR